MPLRKLSIREIRSRPARSLLTLFSIVIGVAAIVATSIATTSARLAQIAMVRAVTGNASLEVEGVGGSSFDATALESLSSMPSISIASPVIRRYSTMTVGESTSNENSTASRNYRIQLIGVIPNLDKKVRNYELVAGTELDQSEQSKAGILMDVSFANTIKVTVGSEVQLRTRAGTQAANVIGLIKPTDAASGLHSGLIIGDLKTVQKWYKAAGKLDVIQVVLGKNDNPKTALESIKGVLPLGVSVREPTMRSQIAGESTVAMEQGFRLAAGFAFLIAAFVIYNTFQMNVGERRRQLGILRSMGATRNQLLWMIVREGIWLGIAGSFIGCSFGQVAALLFRKMFALLLAIDIPPAPWMPLPFVIATCWGITVSLIGAAIPAIRASRMSPSEAMRVVATGEFGTSKSIWYKIGAAIIIPGMLIQAISIPGWVDYKHAVPGAIIMKIGMVVLLPAVIADVTTWVTKFLGFLQAEGKLARRQILRHRGRSSLTIGIVFVATGLVLGMASTILDHIRNVEGWYQRTIIGDFFIRSAMPDMNSGKAADMPDGLEEEVRALPGVTLVDTLRFVQGRSGETSFIILVRQFTATTQDYFDLIEGQEPDVLNGIRGGDVVLGSVLSQRMNLHKGDTLPLDTKDGTATLRVIGVSNDYIAGGLTLYLDAKTAKRLLDVEGTDAIIIKAAPDQMQSVGRRLRDLCEEHGMMFQANKDLAEIIHMTLYGVVGGLLVLLALCAVVASLGLINTLVMNILEQTREIGMLRVVAMTRSQIRKMILAQALIMGLIGIIPGMFTGIWIAYVINLPTMEVTGHAVKFQIYPWLMVGAPVFELIVVVVAAMIPAERAARLNVSTALQYE